MPADRVIQAERRRPEEEGRRRGFPDRVLSVAEFGLTADGVSGEGRADEALLAGNEFPEPGARVRIERCRDLVRETKGVP